MAAKRKSPADMLATSGRALHGELWQRALARDLGIHERQLRRWLVEDSALAADHPLFGDLAQLLRGRAEAQAAAADELAAWLQACRS